MNLSKRRIFLLQPRVTLVAVISLFIGVTMIGMKTASAGVNDFTISSYDITYNLDRDNENHSTLKTTETIVAKFPQFDQNRGIERVLPTSYNGHSTNLKVESVTDENGTSQPYKVRDGSNVDTLRIGDVNTYVRGEKTYVIKYTQKDITRFYEDANVDEFYWDTNGTGWKQPINRFSARLNIDESLEESLNGNTACYKGKEGSTQKCEITKRGTTYTTSAENLQPNENVTIAIGFKPGTFEAYKETAFDIFAKAWLLVQAILIALTTIGAIWLAIKFYRDSNRSSEQKPIAPEYIPSKDGSIALSAKLLSRPESYAAQLIDLAVRHYVRIFEIEAEGLFGRKKLEYSVEIIKPIDDLRDEEKEFANDIFSNKTNVGTVLALKDLKKDKSLSLRLSNNGGKISKLMLEKYELREKPSDSQKNWYKRIGYMSFISAVVLLSPTAFFFGMTALIMADKLRPLTDKGLAFVRYLKGLELYIRTAEQERLKMLQSPEGAAKVNVDTSSNTNLVKLYERTLPYAMLFGKSKEWNKQLAEYYEATSSRPDWYAGSAGAAAFNAASFTGAMSSFSSSISSSAPNSGSSGGGSSGGGGGGGGGGGW